MVLPSQYQLHGHTLSTETEEKYLGVKITADLCCDAHITDVCNKTNKTLGFLKRNIKTTNERLGNTAYKAFVQPVLEYASPFWDPFTANNIKALEKVQRVGKVGKTKLQKISMHGHHATTIALTNSRKAAKASIPHHQVPAWPHAHQDTALQNPTTHGEPPGTPTTPLTTFYPTGQHTDK